MLTYVFLQGFGRQSARGGREVDQCQTAGKQAAKHEGIEPHEVVVRVARVLRRQPGQTPKGKEGQADAKAESPVATG